VKRIVVIGNGGGGKTTLARALGSRLGLPVLEVDRVQWWPGWERAPLEETVLELERWAAGDAWIIDGFGPLPVIDRRFDRADTIIHVDYAFARHLWWSAKRQVASRLRREAWAGQARPPKSVALFQTLLRVHALRPRLLELTSRDDRGAKLVHLRSPAEMRRWLDALEVPAGRAP
jgi:adenylate kinase family enzyme